MVKIWPISCFLSMLLSFTCSIFILFLLLSIFWMKIVRRLSSFTFLASHGPNCFRKSDMQPKNTLFVLKDDNGMIPYHTEPLSLTQTH